MSRSLADRYEEKVDRSDVDGCHPWIASRTRDGYGQIKVAGRRELAHRVGWTLAFGPIPEGLKVLHHCDNPPCQRQDHWFLGTVADNCADMVAKGRHPFRGRAWGSATLTRDGHPSTKLSTATCEEVRELYAMGGVSLRGLAEQFGVDHTTIRQVIRYGVR